MPESHRPEAAAGDVHVNARPLVDPADPENLRMAKGLARGVRADFDFGENSDEEHELEATAYLVLVEYAARFDPVASFRVGATRAMVSAIRRYRAGDLLPADPVPGQLIQVAGIDVTEWTRDAVRRLTRRRVVTQDACAKLAARVAADYAAQFDIGRAFRGWCSIEVRSRCRREALRLRNGGTFHTTRPGTLPAIVHLPKPRCENCSAVFGAAVTRSDVMPKWAPESSELDDRAPQHRIEQRKRLAGTARDATHRPALDDDDPAEPWSPFDTTPDE